MSTPVIENIAANIATAIGEITVANGYNQDLTAKRPRRNDFSDIAPENGIVLIKQADPEPDESAIGCKTWLQPFAIIALVIDSDGTATSIDTRINQVRSDIEKKLMIDNTRGGYAIDTDILPPQEFDDGAGFSGITVRIAVKYRTDENDPYTQR